MAKMMVIETCSGCKHCFKCRDYTSDSFETCFRFDCRHEKVWDKNPDTYGKSIARYVDWYEKDPKPPVWCPLDDA